MVNITCSDIVHPDAACQHVASRLRNSMTCDAHADVGRTVAMRRPLEFLRYMFGSRSLIGKTFENVVDRVVTRPDVQALVAMITEGTCSAGPGEVDASYMVRAMAEMWSPGTQLQYPKVRLRLPASMSRSSEATASFGL